jgi:hypothetical protein
MRFCAFATIVLLAGTAGLRAQTNPAPTNAAPAKPAAAAAESKALSILTPDQINEYAAARKKALVDNPALDSENEALKAEYADVMLHGTAAQKQAVLEKVDSHRQKLRAAMLKEDPNLEPIFNRIDASMSEMKAKGTAPAN